MSGWSKSGFLSSCSIRTFSSATAIGFRWCFSVARSTRTGRCLVTRPSQPVTSTCHKYFSTRLIRRCTCTPTQRNSRRLSHRSWYFRCAASRLTTTTGVKRHPWMSVRCRSGCVGESRQVSRWSDGVEAVDCGDCTDLRVWPELIFQELNMFICVYIDWDSDFRHIWL